MAKQETSGVDPRFQRLLTLIALMKNARHKAKKSELEFLMVNQTFNLVPYRHCVSWDYDGHEVAITAASGLVQIDNAGPYAQWLQKTVARFIRERKPAPAQEGSEEESFASVITLSPADCPPDDAENWAKWVSAYALLLPMKDRHGKIVRGLWIDREIPFGDLEIALIEDVSDAFAAALQQFDRIKSDRKTEKIGASLLKPSRSKIKYVILAGMLALLIPVRLSANAPAEIVPRNPYVISIPFDGTIEKVEVLPGESVKKGDLLVTMDATMLRNRSETASMEMTTAEISYSKTEREAFTDKSKLADLAVLKSQVEQKAAEKKFADDMLARSEIRAERDGIVIFPDPNALRGKPVQTGEQIMQLADPDDSELLIRVPVENMIRIDESVPPTFFLNVTPLGLKKASYESIGYQASPDPDGLMTYKIRAKFETGGNAPRIGWTGTGKIYGHRTIMLFNILRRPMVTLRHKLGV